MEWIVIFVTMAFGNVLCNPIKGITKCLNNDDCLGSNRRCHRNSTLLTGLCTCKEGYVAANNDRIACLNTRIGECVDTSDCLPNYICHSKHQYLGARDISASHSVKSCIFAFDASEGPRVGGGLRSSHIYDHFFVGRRNRIHPPFHPEYIKFIEDAMLVLFLLCVLVALLIVHRASCYRSVRNSRRNGALRFILPHSDDIPPPYSHYGPTTSTNLVSNTIEEASTVERPSIAAAAPSVVLDETDESSFKRPETPPPSYAEALRISRHTESNYVALPPSQETKNSV